MIRTLKCTPAAQCPTCRGRTEETTGPVHHGDYVSRSARRFGLLAPVLILFAVGGLLGAYTWVVAS